MRLTAAYTAHHKTNSMPFYNNMISSSVGIGYIRTSSFLIQLMYAFDTTRY
jgi:hypothetical protein